MAPIVSPPHEACSQPSSPPGHALRHAYTCRVGSGYSPAAHLSLVCLWRRDAQLLSPLSLAGTRPTPGRASTCRVSSTPPVHLLLPLTGAPLAHIMPAARPDQKPMAERLRGRAGRSDRSILPAHRTPGETVARSITARAPLGWQVHGAGSCYLRALEPKATRRAAREALLAAERGLVRAPLQAPRARHGGPTEPASRSGRKSPPRRPPPCGRCWGPRRCGTSAEEACRGLSPPWRRADRRAATAGTHARRVARRPRRRDAGAAAGDQGAWAGGPAAPAARPAAGRLLGARRRPWWRRSGALLFSTQFADSIGLSTWCHALACRSLVEIVVCMGEGYPSEVPRHERHAGESL